VLNFFGDIEQTNGSIFTLLGGATIIFGDLKSRSFLFLCQHIRRHEHLRDGNSKHLIFSFLTSFSFFCFFSFFIDDH